MVRAFSSVVIQSLHYCKITEAFVYYIFLDMAGGVMVIMIFGFTLLQRSGMH